MQIRHWWPVVLLGALFVFGCSEEVTFEGKDQSLTYSCSNFESKVENEKDLELLATEMREAVQKMKKTGQRARAQKFGVEIRAALRERDRSRFEELAVSAKCAIEHPSTRVGTSETGSGGEASVNIPPERTRD
ncbi:MAG: hypothetical protein ABEK75_09895 [Salinibacter sp.]